MSNRLIATIFGNRIVSPISRRKAISSAPLAIRGGCHARINFGTAATTDAELVIEYLRKNIPLARECRPVPPGARSLEIKTHPEASHISCSLLFDGQSIDNEAFTVDCSRPTQPVNRHFIVIGAMKAGTTTLFELLMQHPALCRTYVEVPDVSFIKEINYFRSLYRKGHTPLHYDWRFPFDSESHAWTLDVSPNYAKWPHSRGVPARIASLKGTVKLAYILREPIDRIESHLAHALRAGRAIKTLRHCIRTSQYAMQLDKFMTHFQMDDILLLDFEQLQRDPRAIMARICNFLGIELFETRALVHNKRGVRFRLSAKERADLVDTLRPDVERLIDTYGFEPAAEWLRRRPLSWIRLPTIRR